MTYKILTDSACDLTAKQLKELDVESIRLQVCIPDCDQHDVGDSDDEMKAFYDRLRNGEKITTTAVNLDQAIDAMESILSVGQDVLYLGFDSSLSSTYQNVCAAAQELAEQYPERKIYTLDTLCASLGFGLLVTLTAKKRLDGWDIEQTLDYAKKTAPQICHWFTVNDLFFLKRGGRVGAATAMVGTLLHIKPILHCDAEGKLTVAGKARGRRKALQAQIDKMKDGMLETDEAMICHGDCIDDALWLKEQMLALGVKKVSIGYIGPVIAAHAGPECISVFYVGSNR